MKQIHFEHWDILGKQAGGTEGDFRTIFRLPSERFLQLGIQAGDYFTLNNTMYQIADASLIDPTMAELFCLPTAPAAKQQRIYPAG